MSDGGCAGGRGARTPGPHKHYDGVVVDDDEDDGDSPLKRAPLPLVELDPLDDELPALVEGGVVDWVAYVLPVGLSL